jgi:hypothetical protein
MAKGYVEKAKKQMAESSDSDDEEKGLFKRRKNKDKN